MVNIQHSTSARAPEVIYTRKPPKELRRARKAADTRIATASNPETAPVAAAPPIDLKAVQLDRAYKAFSSIDRCLYWAKVADRSIDLALDEIGTFPGCSDDELSRAYLATQGLSLHIKKAMELWREANEILFPLTGASTTDPVVALWEEVRATEVAVCTTPESDEAAYSAAERRMLDAAERFMAATPTTAAGIGARLKYLALIGSHASGPDVHAEGREIEIVRDAVRQLTGDPNWTIEQEV